MRPIIGGRAARALRLLVVLAPLMASGCDPEPTIDPKVWRMARCIECESGEMDSVVSLGASAVPGLRQFLLEGPPDSAVQRQDSALTAPFTGGAAGGGRATRGVPGGPPPTRSVPGVPPPPAPPPAVIQLLLDDFVANYRIRASLALGLIGGNAARRALCEGKALQFRPDVQRMIDSGLVLLNGTCP